MLPLTLKGKIVEHDIRTHREPAFHPGSGKTDEYGYFERELLSPQPVEHFRGGKSVRGRPDRGLKAA